MASPVMPPAPIPWSTRLPMSMGIDVDSPHSTDPIMNTINATANTRRRP